MPLRPLTTVTSRIDNPLALSEFCILTYLSPNCRYNKLFLLESCSYSMPSYSIICNEGMDRGNSSLGCCCFDIRANRVKVVEISGRRTGFLGSAPNRSQLDFIRYNTALQYLCDRLISFFNIFVWRAIQFWEKPQHL
jgi:hypothetical protein